jgi:hypothetical protein
MGNRQQKNINRSNQRVILMLLYTGLVIGLITVFLQDLKHRHIHVLLPILLFIISYIIFKKKQFLGYEVVAYNILFVLLTLVLLVTYMSIKNKSYLNPFENYFGLGDLLFYIAITPLFVTYNYILFFILSMLFSVVLQLVFSKSMKVKTVPLAGFSALFLILVVTKDVFFDIKPLTLIC